jgi:hypothetical protein
MLIYKIWKCLIFERIRLFIIVLLCFSVRLYAQLSQADPFLEEAKMRHVKMLVDLSLHDTRPADAAEFELIKKAQEEKELHRLQVIQTEPDLGPYLVALAEQISAEKSDGLTGVLQAMALRKDVNVAVAQQYIQRANTIINLKPNRIIGYDYDLVLGVTDLLQLLPSKENENTLIEILKLGQRMNNDALMFSVARAVAQMGTIRSLSALEEAMESIRLNRSDSDSELVTKFRSYLLKLKERIQNEKN